MAKKNRWFLPTNLDNLKMIIAQGLISSPDGFKKYYSDVLELVPGYIPIFKNKIPIDILNHVTIEENSLVPCILEVNIGMIEGIVKKLESNTLVDIDVVDIDKTNNKVLFIQTPLPLVVISKVIFRTSVKKSDFENDATLYSNVPLGGLVLHHNKTDQKLFEKTKADNFIDASGVSLEILKNIDTSTLSGIDYRKVYAFGGMLINLFYYSKNGQISHEMFTNAINCNQNTEDDESIILDFFCNNYPKNKIKIDELIYHSIIKTAIEHTKHDDFKQGILDFLISEDKTSIIAKKMKDFESGGDKPVSEYFKEAKTRYGKALLMLFVREDSESLIDYNLDLFDEHDYLILAMLFGIRDKFSGVPKFIREFEGLQDFVSVKMTNYAHEMINSSISIKEQKTPLTLIEMLKNNRFKEYIAKKMKIETCFETIIPATEYKVVKGRPVLPGIIIPKFEVLEDAYFDFMSKYKLTDYNTLLKKYKKIR